MSEAHKQAATQTLSHYLRILFEQAGLQWDADNDAEIRALVDDIIQGAIEP